MIIQPRTERVKPSDYGREWSWTYDGGDFRTHARNDFEGAAKAVLKFILTNHAFDDTALRYRIDHIGNVLRARNARSSRSGTAANSVPSATSSTATPGSRPASNPPDNTTTTALATSHR